MAQTAICSLISSWKVPRMPVYNPSEETVELLASLTNSEGLFIWKP